MEFHAVNLIIREVYDPEEYDLQMPWYQEGTNNKSGLEGAQGVVVSSKLPDTINRQISCGFITAALPAESNSYLFLALVRHQWLNLQGDFSIVKVALTLQGPSFAGGIHSLLLDPMAPRQSMERQVSMSKMKSSLQLPKISNMKC